VGGFKPKLPKYRIVVKNGIYKAQSRAFFFWFTIDSHESQRTAEHRIREHARRIAEKQKLAAQGRRVIKVEWNDLDTF
jgi:hypothetical protein